MRLRAIIPIFLLLSCVFCGVNGSAVAATTNTTLASVAFVEGTISRDNSGNVAIHNSANSSVTLSQNPQTSNNTIIGSGSAREKEVPTIGWTDSNRTSKVRSGGENGTTLVNMWIE
ncbi:MAG: hypothetical protein IKP24_03115 [Alphaproteobacteria bacterium]|nr:hypothetical protein [Alphaproteobacteria bacterium]